MPHSLACMGMLSNQLPIINKTAKKKKKQKKASSCHMTESRPYVRQLLAQEKQSPCRPFINKASISSGNSPEDNINGHNYHQYHAVLPFLLLREGRHHHHNKKKVHTLEDHFLPLLLLEGRQH